MELLAIPVSAWTWMDSGRPGVGHHLVPSFSLDPCLWLQPTRMAVRCRRPGGGAARLLPNLGSFRSSSCLPWTRIMFTRKIFVGSRGILLLSLSELRKWSSELALLRGTDRPDIRPVPTRHPVSKFILDTFRSPSSMPRKRCPVWTLFRRAGRPGIRPCLTGRPIPKCIRGIFFTFTLGFFVNFFAQLPVRLALQPCIASAVDPRSRE